MGRCEDLVERHERLLPDVHRFALDYLEALKFNQEDPQQLYAVCLCCRLIELAHAAEVLFKQNALAGVPIILRSMFEADIDMTNVITERDYFKQMYVSFLHQKKRLLEAANKTNPQNAFLKPIGDIHDVDKDLADVTTEINSLKAQAEEIATT